MSLFLPGCWETSNCISKSRNAPCPGFSLLSTFQLKPHVAAILEPTNCISVQLVYKAFSPDYGSCHLACQYKEADALTAGSASSRLLSDQFHAALTKEKWPFQFPWPGIIMELLYNLKNRKS